MVAMLECVFDTRGHFELLRAKFISLAQPPGDSAVGAEDIVERRGHRGAIVP